MSKRGTLAYDIFTVIFAILSIVTFGLTIPFALMCAYMSTSINQKEEMLEILSRIEDEQKRKR